MNSLFGYNLGEVKVVTARMRFLVSGFGSGTETLAVKLKHKDCGDQICRLKNYPVLDTVGRTFQVYQGNGFPIDTFGNDRLLEHEVKDLAQLIKKGTLHG
jgi:hypothetical protein